LGGVANKKDKEKPEFKAWLRRAYKQASVGLSGGKERTRGEEKDLKTKRMVFMSAMGKYLS